MGGKKNRQTPCRRLNSINEWTRLRVFVFSTHVHQGMPAERHHRQRDRRSGNPGYEGRLNGALGSVASGEFKSLFLAYSLAVSVLTKRVWARLGHCMSRMAPLMFSKIVLLVQKRYNLKVTHDFQVFIPNQYNLVVVKHTPHMMKACLEFPKIGQWTMNLNLLCWIKVHLVIPHPKIIITLRVIRHLFLRHSIPLVSLYLLLILTHISLHIRCPIIIHIITHPRMYILLVATVRRLLPTPKMIIYIT